MAQCPEGEFIKMQKYMQPIDEDWSLHLKNIFFAHFQVLFPLLTKLLDNVNPQDPTGMEETRMRASTLLCKVFFTSKEFVFEELWYLL